MRASTPQAVKNASCSGLIGGIKMIGWGGRHARRQAGAQSHRPIVTLCHHLQVLGLLEKRHGLAPLAPLGVVRAHLAPRCGELRVVASALFQQLNHGNNGCHPQQQVGFTYYCCT